MAGVSVCPRFGRYTLFSTLAFYTLRGIIFEVFIPRKVYFTKHEKRVLPARLFLLFLYIFFISDILFLYKFTPNPWEQSWGKNLCP